MGGAPGGFGGVTTEKCSPGRVWSGELAVWGDVRGGIEGDRAQPRPPQAGDTGFARVFRRSRNGLRPRPAVCK